MSIRSKYVEHGVDEYYKNHAHDYQNPHEELIKDHLRHYIHGLGLTPTSILDLCCGGGEVTKYLDNIGFDNIVGCDPYTHELYENNTSKECLRLDFKNIVQDGLPKRFDLIVCSFAMHLCPQSMMDTLLYNLSVNCNKLLIISPNKKPDINSYFELIDEIEMFRVRSRLYVSKN